MRNQYFQRQPFPDKCIRHCYVILQERIHQQRRIPVRQRFTHLLYSSFHAWSY